jgi:Flp pilus assembly protein TadG
MTIMNRTRIGDTRGQTLIEFAVALPFLLLIFLGVVDMGYLLLDQHVVTKLSREGSNLTSRNTSLQDAGAALKGMSSRPVNFDGNSRMILSVIRKVSTTGAANFNQEVLYARYEYGTLAATSKLTTAGAPSFGSAPDYQASNSDNNTSLQVTNLPPGLMVSGGMLYVTEIYTKHTLLTPLDKFGVTLPQTLYSIAYF